MVESYFAQSYVEARARFIAAASGAGARLSEYECPAHTGYRGERLTVDVATIGPDTGRDALLIVSGTHGVEGFCGSGCQVGFLTDRVHESLAADTRAVLVHALNPFGFSWLRRVNEDNVDLNRNFRDFTAEPPPSTAYEALHDALIPEEWDGPARARADQTLQAHAMAQGMRAFQAAVSGGQYTRPSGLFFGGTRATWSNQIFRRILADHLPAGLRRLGAIDIHSGLGPSGYGEPIHGGGGGAGAVARARTWFGPDVRSTESGDSVSAAVTGSLPDSLTGAHAGEVTAITLEFGTRSIVEVLTALRADHWLHATPERWAAAGHMRDAIKRQIRDAFYVDAPGWKAAVYGRAVDVILRAVRGLAA